MTAPQGPRVKLTLRLAPALHQRLAALAATDRRSLNSYILLLVERAAGETKEPT